MPHIFRLDASIREAGSATRAIADSFETALRTQPGVSIVRRDVGLNPLPSTAWANAAFAPYTPAEQRTEQQRQGTALATQLADELVNADAYIFAIPLYNFGVSQHFKTWADIVLTDPRLGPGGPTAIKGRPAQLITARGGGYAPGTPRHGWDHATAWYQRALADIFLLDLEVIECELTLADVTPAMAGLRDLAAQNLANAHATASQLGQRFGTPARAEPVLDFAGAGR